MTWNPMMCNEFIDASCDYLDAFEFCQIEKLPYFACFDYILRRLHRCLFFFNGHHHSFGRPIEILSARNMHIFTQYLHVLESQNLDSCWNSVVHLNIFYVPQFDWLKPCSFYVVLNVMWLFVILQWAPVFIWFAWMPSTFVREALKLWQLLWMDDLEVK